MILSVKAVGTKIMKTTVARIIAADGVGKC